MAFRLEDQDAPTRQALVALGSVFVELRRSRGLTQRGLARNAGLSQSTISRLETGKAPWLSAAQIARLLAGLDLVSGHHGFGAAATPSPAVGWETLMRRFDATRRRRELAELAETHRINRERILEALQREFANTPAQRGAMRPRASDVDGRAKPIGAAPNRPGAMWPRASGLEGRGGPIGGE